jgi:hypothetical protein
MQVISGDLFPESWIELDSEVASIEAAWLAAQPPAAVDITVVGIDARGEGV